MHLIAPIITRLRGRVAAEDGFTMATAMLALLVVSLAMAATVTAVNGDIKLTNNDLDHKRAYEAAQAGLADYAFHLNNDNAYWAKCTNVPTPNAVNNVGSTAKRRNVPGNTGASYALELIPATGKSVCSTSDPVGSMIEQSSGVSNGTFRIRSTGYSGEHQAEHRRLLQARQLPRLRLLHAVRDIGPSHLRQLLERSRRRTHSASGSTATGAVTARFPARRSFSSAVSRSTGRCTPTTSSTSAARRPSGGPPRI